MAIYGQAICRRKPALDLLFAHYRKRTASTVLFGDDDKSMVAHSTWQLAFQSCTFPPETALNLAYNHSFSRLHNETMTRSNSIHPKKASRLNSLLVSATSGGHSLTAPGTV
jgi:hypothetical protein